MVVHHLKPCLGATVRHILRVLHRWMGLFTAVFLAISGLTGAVISWDHELDAALNPQMYKAQWQQPQSALDLANQFEASAPDLMVSFLPLQHEPGHALNIFVSPRTSQAKQSLTYNQVAMHPESGAVQATRLWGEISLARENLLPFLYKLHYSMHLPDIASLETGILLMGLVAMVWSLDCVVALLISFPSTRNWRKSFAFRLNRGAYKLNFDLHRSGGVWLWALLLILAVTSVSMNLEHQVVRPLVNTISPLSPSPFTNASYAEFSAPEISRENIILIAANYAEQKGIDEPMGGIFYSSDFNLYGVGFFEPGNSHGDGGLGNTWLYFNGADGSYSGATIPGQGSAGDIYMQAQFPLHSGRILGIWGRVIMSIMGIAVAGLSITGIVIWARKRRARRLSLQGNL